MQNLQNDFETLAAFRYALRRFLRFSERAAAQYGLTPQQHQALLAIQGFPGRDRITITDLAERLQLAHHSVVGLVDRLVRQGLVTRQPSPRDKRCVLVKVSPKGRALLTKLTAAHKKELATVGPDLFTALRTLSRGWKE
jgi:DNA-binding MarR family transcriptional regulator